ITTEGLVLEGEDLGALAANERAWSELRASGGETYALIGSSGAVTGDENSGARY
ncbi:MAG: hypothetical protein GWO02_05220, partial [Gammaproteobacteria bacterium]|nr:hypothetical protein [Gammaproteobacteria bacterium]